MEHVIDTLFFVSIFIVFGWILARIVQIVTRKRIDKNQYKFYARAGFIGVFVKILVTSFGNTFL